MTFEEVIKIEAGDVEWAQILNGFVSQLKEFEVYPEDY